MKHRPLAGFFLLAFVISWACWLLLPVAIHNNSPGAYKALKWLGLFGPCLAALVLTLQRWGMDGVARLLGRLLIWRVGWFWYGIALLLPTVISLVITGLHLLVGGVAPDFSVPPIYRIPLAGFFGEYNAWTILVPFFCVSLIRDTALTEEVAWRGFVLPRLQKRFHTWIAAVLVGLAVVVWRLPLMIDVTGFSGKPIAVALLGAVAFSILVTWIFNQTGGSLLLTVLFTNSYKITDLFLASPPDVKPLTLVAGYWIVAGTVLALFGPATLTRGPIPVSALADDTAA